MNKTQVLRKVRVKRKNPYRHKIGKFALTASFRDEKIGQALVNIVGELVQICTQKEAARILGMSPSMVGKLCRIFYFQHQ